MKRFVVIGIGVVVLLAIAMVYSVWRASQEPVTHSPGPLETGRMELRAQLDQARKSDSDVEKQHWNSTDDLRVLIQGHELRIEKLKDNKEAASIVAYDRDSIDRLQKRIIQIAEEEAAKAEAAKAEAARAEAARQAAQESPPQ